MDKISWEIKKLLVLWPDPSYKKNALLPGPGGGGT